VYYAARKCWHISWLDFLGFSAAKVMFIATVLRFSKVSRPDVRGMSGQKISQKPAPKTGEGLFWISLSSCKNRGEASASNLRHLKSNTNRPSSPFSADEFSTIPK
jgi:hypothetical protein